MKKMKIREEFFSFLICFIRLKKERTRQGSRSRNSCAPSLRKIYLEFASGAIEPYESVIRTHSFF